MQSITWPSGLERPVTPATTCRVRPPLPTTIRPCEPAIVAQSVTGVRVGHVAAWCIGGAIGWIGAIAGGQFAIDLVGRLV